MHTEQNKIKRYIRLDQLLRDSEGHTLNEILSDPQMDDISKRSLQDNLKEFETVFGAEFDYTSRRGREGIWKYKDPNFSIFQQIDRDLEIIHKSIQNLKVFKGDPQYDLIRLFLMGLECGCHHDMPFMSFDSNLYLQGLENIETIGLSILKKHPIKLWYKPFHGKEFTTNVHPYYLKQYNNRWHLIALSEDNGALYNYPIDRIVKIEHLSKPYISSTINFEEYFDDIVGLTNYKEKPVETIQLRISKKSIDYIRTKPLHHTQKELHELEDDESVCVQIEVKLNRELSMLILSYGDAIEVLSPTSLRKEISEIAERMNAVYNKL